MCEYDKVRRGVACKQETLPNVGLILAHRLRRWANIDPILWQRIVFSGWRPHLNLCQQPGQRQIEPDTENTPETGTGEHWMAAQ